MTGDLRGWMPVHLAAGESRIDWAVIRDPLSAPFFEQDAELAMRRPFNQLFARQTRLDVLDALAGAADVREPAGIIVHMSRCGSTLVAQMLARLPSLIVLGEAQPFDGLVRRRGQNFDDERLARALRGLLRAFDSGDGRRIVIKAHASHVLHLDLLRRAFPSAPWVFVFREPRAVLRSQDRRVGAELLPGAIPAALLGIANLSELYAPDYGARVIAALCGAALRNAHDARALFVDYAELPDAVASRIAPFLGVVPTARESEAMREAAAGDTKLSGAPFTANREPVSAAIEAQARRWLDEPYAALRIRAAR